MRINFGKFETVPVKEVQNIEALLGDLGCCVSTLPMKYLGLPLGATFKEASIWDRILDHVQRRLAGWKKSYLSKRGHLTLIKSTLSSLPTHFMSLFSLPVGVAKGMEKFQRDFLWRGFGGGF